MDKTLNDYLETVERSLKPLPVSERVDIVKEIKSEMLELQGGGKTAGEIVERLGDPKALAKAYLGDLIAEGGAFSGKRVLALCAYYSLAGLSGMFVIPVLAICAPVFILCAAVAPISGAVKLIDALFGLGIPFAARVGIAGIENPFAVFVLSIVLGAALYLIGWGCWRLLLRYIRGVSSVKQRLPR